MCGINQRVAGSSPAEGAKPATKVVGFLFKVYFGRRIILGSSGIRINTKSWDQNQNLWTKQNIWFALKGKKKNQAELSMGIYLQFVKLTNMLSNLNIEQRS
ncbi:hypothetical protein SAMN04488511_107124 [Pedobacter suwonensis]|uniref:Arm DNA-binding domain-containing protein n=1 Tax=Pedobacter suwonensis TaxID=332999 RepID=A0A1I0T9P7_9SPHI|nr:hypothetical protein SAMN04488511_107124 [Pedobacter suwonensis]